MVTESMDLLISRLLDDDLPPEEARRVRGLIERDPAAARLFRELSLTVEWARSLAAEQAPVSLIVNLRDAIARPPAWRRALDGILGAPVFTPARALAMVFVAAVIGGLVWVLPQFREGAAPTAPMQVADRTLPRGSIHAVPAGVPADARTANRKTEETRAGETATGLARPEKATAAAGSPAEESRMRGVQVAGSRPLPFTPSPLPPPQVAGVPTPRDPRSAVPNATLVVYGPSEGYLSRLSRPVSAGGSLEAFYADDIDDESVALKAEAPRVGGSRSQIAATTPAPSAKDAGEAAPATEKDARKVGAPAKLVRQADAVALPRKGMADKTPEASTTGRIRLDKANVVKEYKGGYGGLKDRGTFVIETEGDWAGFWERLTSNVTPAPKAPEFDFQKDFALAIAMGEKRFGGFETTISGIELVGKTLRVYVEESKPKGGMGMTLALTQPYHVLILPRVIGGQRFASADGFNVEFIYQ